MTRCTDFWKKWRKEPNFCGLSQNTVDEIEDYLSTVDKICTLGIAEDTVYENFPEGAARPLLRMDEGDPRTNVLNFVIKSLKSGEKLTGKMIQTTIKRFLSDEVVSKDSAKVPQLRKPKEPFPVEKESKRQDPSKCFSPQPGTVEVSDAPPQPSLADQLKDLPPLSSDADITERLKRDEVLLARMAATKPGFLDPGDTAFSRASNPPLPKTETRWGAGKILTREEKMHVLCTQILTPKQVAVLKMLVKAGEADDELQALDVLIDEAQERMEAQ
jgi:hypothetical protein